MIIPYFEQAPSNWPPDCRGKWWCSNGKNDLQCRYMSPIGWRERAHWYETKEEAEADFNKFEKQNLAGLAASEEFAAIERRMKMVEKVMELSMENEKLRQADEPARLENIKLKSQVAALIAANREIFSENLLRICNLLFLFLPKI